MFRLYKVIFQAILDHSRLILTLCSILHALQLKAFWGGSWRAGFGGGGGGGSALYHCVQHVMTPILL